MHVDGQLAVGVGWYVLWSSGFFFFFLHEEVDPYRWSGVGDVNRRPLVALVQSACIDRVPVDSSVTLAGRRAPADLHGLYSHPVTDEMN